jgi:hypothetical protein
MLVWLGIYGACFGLHIFLVGDGKLTIDKFEQRLHRLLYQTLLTVMCHTIQAQPILSNFKICNVPHHTGTNNCIEAFKIICACRVWHITVLKVSI